MLQSAGGAMSAQLVRCAVYEPGRGGVAPLAANWPFARPFATKLIIKKRQVPITCQSQFRSAARAPLPPQEPRKCIAIDV
jgi:hypothetical protein